MGVSSKKSGFVVTMKNVDFLDCIIHTVVLFLDYVFNNFIKLLSCVFVM
jgi:hypothetical protein